VTVRVPLIARAPLPGGCAERDNPDRSASRGGREIPVANIYYLLCYAWDHLEQRDEVVAGAESSTDLLNLFARVLATGTRRLLHRGLDRGYTSHEGIIPAVRGKLLVSRTVRNQLIPTGRAACMWDELEYDTTPNRILKSTIQRLYRSQGVDRRTKQDLHDLLRWLAPITSAPIRADHFRRVQLHRNNRIYSFLLNVCELIHQHWLPSPATQARPFSDFEREGLPKMFESFVRNFYSHELPSWSVSAPHIEWECQSANDAAQRLLPRMETDVCLVTANRAIILDTKFYSNALRGGAYDTYRLSSSNLYQIFTYLRQRSGTPGWETAEGILLYPQTAEPFCADFTTHGHRIRALTLDLTRPWREIHRALLAVVE
jgi:5-methylcytosine-specific restriction enzyme subunit McrC